MNMDGDLLMLPSYNSGEMEIDGKGMDKWRENYSQPWKILPTPFLNWMNPLLGHICFI